MSKTFYCIGIIARLGSTRLHNKHLKNILGKPIIYYLIERIKYEFSVEFKNKELDIVILTGKKQDNLLLGEVAKSHDIKVFYGDNVNIPNRMLEVMLENNYKSIISVDGDDIFCSPEGMRKVFKCLVGGFRYVKTIDYPFGMNSIGLEIDFLKKSLNNNKNSTLETGWGWIFDERQCHTIKSEEKLDQRLRFTLDYEDDFKFFKSVILSDKDIIRSSSKKIIQTVIKNKIFIKNNYLNKNYWKNFNKEQLNEIKGVSNG